MKKIIYGIAILAMVASCMSSCASRKGKTEEIEAELNDSTKIAMEMEQKRIEEPEFEMVTSHGTMKIKLYSKTPKHRENFTKLVAEKYYDGMRFHRVIEGFMIQGGDDSHLPADQQAASIKGEFKSNGYDNPILHKRGVISMARTSDPDSATSQFFITLHDDAKRSLDGKYAAFGYVVKGMSVVDAIAEDLIKAPSSGYMGFVGDEDAITIVSAKILEGYSPD